MLPTTKSKKKKAKDNQILPKPKRPMSAYNYFFREQRNEIIKSFDKDEDADKKKTFQDIGRLIGQRWREIEPDELARYEKLAKEDAERYRKGMEIYHKEELALMCSGNVGVPSPDGDKKPAAAEVAQNPVTSVTASSPPNERPNPTLFNAMSINDLVQLQTTLQQHGTGRLDKEEVINQIKTERDAIKTRLTTLLQESEMLMLKDRLLEQIMSKCLVDSMAISGMQHLANATLPFQPVNPFGLMAPSMGAQAGNPSSNEAFLLQQLANSRSLAAASLANGTQDRRNLAQASVPSPSTNMQTASFKNPSMPVGHAVNQSHQAQTTTNNAVLNQYMEQLAANSTQETARAPNNLELVELAFSNLTQQARMGDASLLNQYMASQQSQQPASGGVNAEASLGENNVAKDSD